MDAFNFVFSLFALVLGLSLTEVLAGFARALRMRRKVRLGWLLPMLAVFLMMDIVSFWLGAWQLRTHITVQYGFLLIGLIVTGVYYLAASITFPAHGETRRDFDEHYFAHHRQILGAVAFCNLVTFTAGTLVYGVQWTTTFIVLNVVYYAGLAVAAATRNARISTAGLIVLIGFYIWQGLTTFVPAIRQIG